MFWSIPLLSGRGQQLSAIHSLPYLPRSTEVNSTSVHCCEIVRGLFNAVCVKYEVLQRNCKFSENDRWIVLFHIQSRNIITVSETHCVNSLVHLKQLATQGGLGISGSFL